MKNKMRLFSIAALAMAVMTLASCQKDEMISGTGTVDLVGWVGASSTMTGAAQYGITTSESTSSTDGYGNAEDEAMKSDWGTLAISNGGNTTNQWHTLTGGNGASAEWYYLLTTRNDADQKYGPATVDGIHGLVVLPDNWTLPAGCTFIGGMSNYGLNVYNAESWATMEAAGAVFLPSAGTREGTSVSNTNSYAHYWSSSAYYNTGNAGAIHFGGAYIQTSTAFERNRGCSVRLVRPVE